MTGTIEGTGLTSRAISYDCLKLEDVR